VPFRFVELRDERGAERDQLVGTGVEFGWLDVDVEMHPVLGRLALGDLQEEHAGPDTARVDDGERAVGIGPVDAEGVEGSLPGVEPWRRRLLDVAEYLTPELAQLARAGGVDGDLDRSCHRSIMPARSTAGVMAFTDRVGARRFNGMASANGVVEAILQSPLHRILSGRLLLIRYLGEHTGTEHTLPVQYAETQHGLVVLVGDAETKTWWRNFTSMGQAKVLRARTWTPMTAHALVGAEEPDAVAPLLRSYAARFPRVVKSLDGDTLEQRVAGAVVVWLRPAT